MKSEILTSSVTHEIFSNIFLEVFFFIFSWNLLPYIHPVKSLLNMSAYPFTEVSFVAASVLDQLPPKLTFYLHLQEGPRTRGFRRQVFFQEFSMLLTIYKPSGVLWQSDLALFLNAFAAFVDVEKKKVKKRNHRKYLIIKREKLKQVKTKYC